MSGLTMRRHAGWLSLAIVVSVALIAAPTQVSGDNPKPEVQDKRVKIDTMAKETLDRLFKEDPGAQSLFDKAHGYAVFDNLKLSLFLSGGGGAGVAIDRTSGTRTYMKMGTAGLNIGLGGQKYQIVFLFQDAATFESFVKKGWQADAGANAVAGKGGANAEASFVKGMAFYQLTENGLMLQADISGTKYWKYDKIN